MDGRYFLLLMVCLECMSHGIVIQTRGRAVKMLQRGDVVEGIIKEEYISPKTGRRKLYADCGELVSFPPDNTPRAVQVNRPPDGLKVGSRAKIWIQDVFPDNKRVTGYIYRKRKSGIQGVNERLRKELGPEKFLEDLKTGDHFPGYIIRITRRGVFVDCNVYRKAKKGKKALVFGALHKVDFTEGVYHPDDILTQEEYRSAVVLNTMMKVEVYVRDIFPGRLCLTLDNSITREKALAIRLVEHDSL